MFGAVQERLRFSRWRILNYDDVVIRATQPIVCCLGRGPAGADDEGQASIGGARSYGRRSATRVERGESATGVRTRLTLADPGATDRRVEIKLQAKPLAPLQKCRSFKVFDDERRPNPAEESKG
jgi:hypothetical protein